MEHSSTSPSSVWNFISTTGTRSTLGRMMQAAPDKPSRMAEQHLALLCSDLPQGDTSSPCLPVLFAMEVILLHDLPEGTAAWTPDSVNTYWPPGSITNEGSWGASDPESRQAGVENSWPTLWHCLLPRLVYPEGQMKARTVFPCQGSLALHREKSWLLPTGNWP